MSKWKLVPVEATDQMIDAALDAKIGGKVLSCAEIYRAMIDAAPVQQTDPLGYFTFNKEWNVWEQMSAKYKNASDATPLYLHPPSAELARLRAENERLRADAARYLWLRDTASEDHLCDLPAYRSEAWNAFIDAAMAQGDKA